MEPSGAITQLVGVDILEREVDPTDVTYEKSVTGKHEPVVDQEAYVLRCVTGGVDHAHAAVADLQDLAL